MSANRSGLAKVEVVVLLAIVPILVGLGVMAVFQSRRVDKNTGRIQTNNNLKQVSLAVHSYHDVHRSFPPATGTGLDMPNANCALSVHLLPYVEQMPLFDQYRLFKDAPAVAVPAFQAPLDETTEDWLRVQNFAGNVRVFTDIGVNTNFQTPVAGLNANNGFCSTALGRTFVDGSSNTIMFASRYANGGKVTRGGTVSCSSYDALLGANNSAFFGVKPQVGPVSATSTGGWQLAPSLSQVNCQFGAVAHAFIDSGIQVGLADGSVRVVSPLVSAHTWNTAMQPNDGFPPGSDW